MLLGDHQGKASFNLHQILIDWDYLHNRPAPTPETDFLEPMRNQHVDTRV